MKYDEIPLKETKYYSQFGQDQWIAEGIYSKLRNGYFVDIGAGKPTIDSNTYFFEKERHWRGIAIDALLFDKEEWLQKRKRTKWIQACLSDKEGELVDVYNEASLGGICEVINPWWKAEMENKNAPIIKLKTKLIGNILRENKVPKIIHYLSIDIEGSDFMVLKSFPFNEFTPILISVECTSEKDMEGACNNLSASKNSLNAFETTREKIVEFMQQKGYDHFVPRTPGDTFFLLKTFNKTHRM